MRPSSFYRGTVLALALASGCTTTNPTEVSYEPEVQGIQAGFISVTPTAAGLVLENQTERPVHFIAMEAETGTRLDWIPCTGGSTCPTVGQGQRVTYPWTSVIGAADDKHGYSLYWWHTVTLPDGTTRASGVQYVRITR